MDNKRPDLNDEDLGMRAFQVRRAKAVERAMDHIRGGLKNTWEMFTQRDLADLAWVQGELWAFVSRESWEAMLFSKLTPEDVFEIVAISRELSEDSSNTVEKLERVAGFIQTRS